MTLRITLLDPSLRDHQGNSSINLGDIVIYQSVSKYLKTIFPEAEIDRISTHTLLEKRHCEQIKNSDFTFIGGTNILSSDIKAYNQWKLSNELRYYFAPKVENVILLGVGWWQYQNDPTLTTKYFYKHVLNKNILHSVRDSYTVRKLAQIGITNVLNTSCPTTWGLDGLDVNRKNLNCKNCLFTITDYNQNSMADTKWIQIILNYYSGDIYFFPQGSRDEEYLNSLKIFHTNKSRIKILEHSIEALSDCLKMADINYIGTRLHTGTLCLQHGIDSVIIAIDNRAAEIAKDIRLPVVERFQAEVLVKWLEGVDIFEPVELPIEQIEKWKNQFN